MLVPATVENLHKSCAALDQTTRHQAGVGKRTTLFGFSTVKIKGMFRLAVEIGQLRHAGLHSECHLILLNTSLNFRITDAFVGLPVHLIEPI